MGLFFATLASLFIASSNLFMRRSFDIGSHPAIVLTIQMATAFLFAIVLGPIRTGSYAINTPITLLGLLAGVLLAWMLYTLSKALATGPPGLTFSIVSSASVMPGIVMAALFGAAYTFGSAAGSLLVLIGLLWAGKGLQGLKDLKTWVLWSLLLFSLHVALLVLYQWRAMLFHLPNPHFSAEEIRSEWFIPMLYLGATLIELLLFLCAIYKKQCALRSPTSKEWLYGCLAGSANCLCNHFLLRATETAKGLELAMILPLFSIGTILYSNIWGRYLYQEKVNWRACQVCLAGVFLGTIDLHALEQFLRNL